MVDTLKHTLHTLMRIEESKGNTTEFERGLLHG